MTTEIDKSTAVVVQTRKEWLKERKKGVGASEVACLFGLDPYGRTIQDLYDEKVSDDAVDGIETPDMQRGRYMEPIILELYQLATLRVVCPVGLQVHPDEPRMLATPDGIIQGDGAPVEVKSVRQKKFSYLTHRGLTDGWLIQVASQLEVTQKDWASYAFHSAENWSLVHFDIERDRELGEALLAKVREFWKYVENRERPENPLVYDLPQIKGVSGSITLRADAEWLELAGQLIEAKRLAETSKEIEAMVKDRVKELMGGYGSHEGGGVRVHYKERAGRKTFDHEALAAQRPVDGLTVVAKLQERYPDLDINVLADLVVASRIDLARFYKQGEKYDEIRSYILKDGADDTEMLPAPRLRLEK